MGVYDQVKASTSSRISPAAGIVGDVTIGDETSVFAGAQLRGDASSIVVGNRCNIQENAVLHVDEGFPVIIGDDVTIGHGAVAHGCTVEDGAMIGMNSLIMDGAVIGRGSMVAACALVTQNKVFPPNSLIMGAPAKLVRALTEEESQQMCWRGAREYLSVSKQMLDEGILFNPDNDFSFQIGD